MEESESGMRGQMSKEKGTSGSVFECDKEREREERISVMEVGDFCAFARK